MLTTRIQKTKMDKRHPQHTQTGSNW
jgi:hypothetical protein